jgi:hypothetical protein
MVDLLYICRESSTNPPFLCKTNPISPIFHLETKIMPKNKAKTNPIQTQFNPKQSQFKPKQSQFKPNFKSFWPGKLFWCGPIKWSISIPDAHKPAIKRLFAASRLNLIRHYGIISYQSGNGGSQNEFQNHTFYCSPESIIIAHDIF